MKNITLKKGEMSDEELASWFDYMPLNVFKCKKTQKLEILKYYCDYDVIDDDHVEVKEIKAEMLCDDHFAFGMNHILDNLRVSGDSAKRLAKVLNTISGGRTKKYSIAQVEEILKECFGEPERYFEEKGGKDGVLSASRGKFGTCSYTYCNFRQLTPLVPEEWYDEAKTDFVDIKTSEYSGGLKEIILFLGSPLIKKTDAGEKHYVKVLTFCFC